jgi:hypothetical protein
MGVFQPAIGVDHQHPRGVARMRGPKRNALVRQVEIEKRNIHLYGNVLCRRNLLGSGGNFKLADRSMINRFIAFALAIALPLAVHAQPLAVHRTVSGTTLNALNTPVARITVPSGFRYVGARRFILGGFDDVELHVFADAGAHGLIRRLYWIQFEGYLPNDPAYAHTYTVKRTASIAGLTFIVDAWPHNSQTVSPGSDDAQMRDLLKSKGLRLPDRAPAIRLVNLDKPKRNELMIIYMEDRAGDAGRNWPALREAMLRRAIAGVTIAR